MDKEEGVGEDGEETVEREPREPVGEKAPPTGCWDPSCCCTWSMVTDTGIIVIISDNLSEPPLPRSSLRFILFDL